MSELVGTRDRVSNYYSVSNGKIVKSFGKTPPENMNGVIQRTNKNGDVVYEIQSDYIRGFIVELGVKPPPEDHPDWQEQMEITLQSGSGKAILNIPFDSAYGRGFLNACEGIDLNQEVELEPYKYFSKAKGKDLMGLQVYQGGEQLPWTMGTKANPGEMPQLEQVEFKGKMTWDNSKQLAFYKTLYRGMSGLVDNFEKGKGIEDMEVDADYVDPEEVDF